MKEDKTRLLQLFYARDLVEANHNYIKYGIFDLIYKNKEKETEKFVEKQIQVFDIKSIDDLYNMINEIYGFANWEIDNFNENEIEAVTSTCILCEIAKKRGIEKPCDLFCINYLKIFLHKLGFELVVNKTLWYNIECYFVHRKLKEEK